MWGSATTLVGRLSRDGDGTCASGHRSGPVSIHFVHWWLGSNAVEVGGGTTGCGIMHGREPVWQSVGVWEEWGVQKERR